MQLQLNPVMLGQDRLEKIFHAALAELGCIVELGTELISFTQSASRVEVRLLVRGMDPMAEGVEEVASFEYMVGTDGARGVVRKQLGLNFLGETRKIENFVVGDIRVEGLSQKASAIIPSRCDIILIFNSSIGTCGETPPVLCWSFVSIFAAGPHPFQYRVSLRGTEEPTLFNFVITGKYINRAQLANDQALLRETLVKSTNREDLKFGECPWISYYTSVFHSCFHMYDLPPSRPNIRMVDKLHVGHVLIAGGTHYQIHTTPYLNQ